MDGIKHKGKYRIPSARATWHDYDGGIYFVTICAKERIHYFGEIICHQGYETKMEMSEIGRYTNEQLANVSTHYPYAEIPLWVVMPNHLHCLVQIVRPPKSPVPVETMCTSSNTIDNHTTDDKSFRWKDDVVNETMQNISKQRGALSIVIGGLKRAITHFARENGIHFQWQPRFHDHIIRNQDELNRIAEYIQNNPAKWALDQLNDAVFKEMPKMMR